MSSASVRSISNGFIISSSGAAGVPSAVYAATVGEIPYWLAKLLDPVTGASDIGGGAFHGPGISMEPQVRVSTFASGGFLLAHSTQQSVTETYCANMDAVANELATIFA